MLKLDTPVKYYYVCSDFGSIGGASMFVPISRALPLSTRASIADHVEQ